jgi:hypothetical protein
MSLLGHLHPQHEGGKSDKSIRAAIDLRSRKARCQIEGVGNDLAGVETTGMSSTARGT